MKVLGLDIGDVWTGSALSDGIGISCRPYKTVKLNELHDFLEEILKEENIGTVVVGHPITLKGKVSEQTIVIENIYEKLKLRFSQVDNIKIVWVLWDERLTSKRAALVMGRESRTREGKSREHSVAAAFILQSYLDSKAILHE
jgi:putative Holliday junction resolvase